MRKSSGNEAKLSQTASERNLRRPQVIRAPVKRLRRSNLSPVPKMGERCDWRLGNHVVGADFVPARAQPGS